MFPKLQLTLTYQQQYYTDWGRRIPLSSTLTTTSINTSMNFTLHDSSSPESYSYDPATHPSIPVLV